MHAQSVRYNINKQVSGLPRGTSRIPSKPSLRGRQVVYARVSPDTRKGLVLPVGSEGSWDGGAVGNPVVRCYVGDNEQRWYMWYSGRSAGGNHTHLDAISAATGSIGVAVSTDGVSWKRGTAPVSGARGEDAQQDVGQVLGPNTDSWWWLDTYHLGVSDVQVFSNSNVSGGVGVYWMLYSGGDREQVPVPPALQDICGTPGEAGAQGQAEATTSAAQGQPASADEGALQVQGLRLRPGLAMSQDGRNWARIEGDHHSGALFDVGEPGEWDELCVAAPKLLAAGPRDMRLYYTSFCSRQQRFLLGLALSPDGFRWSKQGPMFEGSRDPDAFDARGVASAHVVRDPDSGQFFLFYEGVARDGSRSIGLAVSRDGKSGWRRHGQPLLAASADAGEWDCGSVGTPWGLSMSGGRWRLYYSGRSSALGPWQGIGVALSSPDAPLFEGAPTAFTRRTGSS